MWHLDVQVCFGIDDSLDASEVNGYRYELLLVVSLLGQFQQPESDLTPQ